MASKTALSDAVRGHRAREVAAMLAESPELLEIRDPRGRNWLHRCCGVDRRSAGLSAAAGLRTADVLLAAGLDLDEEAFSEGEWKATPVWFSVARGRNLALTRHLLALGASPEHSLWAAAYHDDVASIRLLVEHGARVDPVVEDETPFLSAVKSSHFAAARALLELGADVDFQDSKGRTGLHYMLRKNSDPKHFRTIVGYGPRGDLVDCDGLRVVDAMRRKRAPSVRKLADALALG